MTANLTFRNEKQLVVEPVPVHRRTALARGDLEQHAADAVLGQRTVFVDADCHGPEAECFGGIFFV